LKPKEIGAVLICDLEGYMQKVLYDSLAISTVEMTGKKLQNCFTPDSAKTFRYFTREVMKTGASFGSTVKCQDHQQCLSLNLTGVLLEGNILLIATMARPETGFDRLYDDISALNNELINTRRELAKKNAELDQLASVDALTGVSNRRIILQRVDEHFRLARRYGIIFSLIMADLDRFKLINDTYGHLTGDKVLKIIAGIIFRSLRETDYAGRYGGEEFLILLANTGPDEAVQAAERIRRTVSETRFEAENGLAFDVTVSLGIATCHDDASLEEMIERADKALYRAKQKGRNRVEA